ncbi:MAG: 3-dehydroquinate synthase [Ignavibacteria bacterium]|nr:3-dehydroquinate synthase [Ignavibacteria bacterium]
MKKFVVKTASCSYPYIIGDDTSSFLPFINSHLGTPGTLFFLIDENVLLHWRASIFQSIAGLQIPFHYFVIPSGEKAKSFTFLQKVLAAMLDKKLDRHSVVVAIGGGVAGDLAGFASSIYKRGIRVVHIPTTLLSMVDSSVGGKTGINFNGFKNMIGTFHQPSMVLADVNFLSSLSQTELYSGLGEVLKYAFLGDEKNYKLIAKYLQKGDFSGQFPQEIIYTCARLKAGVIEQDEFETGIRKILNLGHTFAHAYETLSRYKIPHGQAVTIGVKAAVHTSEILGLLTQEQSAIYLALVDTLPVKYNLRKYKTDDLIAAMSHDKKGRTGKPLFILLSGIGEILIDVPVEEKVLKQVFEKL